MKTFLKEFSKSKLPKLPNLSWAFIFVVLIQALPFLYLILTKRMVTHDTFFLFYGQYYFLNNSAIYGEIPQWIPYLTLGAPAVYFQGIQSMVNLLTHVFLLVAPILNGISFLPIFYLTVFFDMLILIIGVWLLSKRFYKSTITTCFVTITICLSSIWFREISLNFHIYYAIPFILYLFHKFLDDGNWKPLFLALNFIILFPILTLSYLIGVVSLAIFLYLCCSILINFKTLRKNLSSQIKVNKTFWIGLGLTILNGICVYYLLSAGRGSNTILSNVARNLDGSVPLNIFLTYGGLTENSWWIEYLLGFSLIRDFTRYAGIITIPFLIIGLISNHSIKRLPVFTTAVILALIASSNLISKFFYACWPLLNYFRHISAINSIVKLFFCFFAGFGFDTIMAFCKNKKKIPRFQLILFSPLFIFLGIFIRKIALDAFFVRNYPTETFALQIHAFIAIFAGILFILLIFIPNFRIKTSLLIGILILQIVDLGYYQMQELIRNTYPLNANQYQTTFFRPLIYRQRRNITDLNNPRLSILDNNILMFSTRSVIYWMVNAYLMNDSVQTKKLSIAKRVEVERPRILNKNLFVHNWQQPYDKFLRAYWDQDITDYEIPLKGFNQKKRALDFPTTHTAAQKYAGLSKDKIQFFSQAYFSKNDKSLAQIMADPKCKGNQLFLSHLSIPYKYQNLSELEKMDVFILNKNERVNIDYKITRFESNHLEINVDAGERAGLWLYYSDVWHPNWRATVNDKHVPVFRANLAFKAVPLEKGQNKIHFYFTSKLLSWICRFIGLNCLFWVIFLLVKFYKISIKTEGQTEEKQEMI